tara:strand:- start:294 stop:497 length:204 start_codon:yes stop_codon:yes gene_type:complete
LGYDNGGDFAFHSKANGRVAAHTMPDQVLFNDPLNGLDRDPAATTGFDRVLTRISISMIWITRSPED